MYWVIIIEIRFILIQYAHVEDTGHLVNDVITTQHAMYTVNSLELNVNIPQMLPCNALNHLLYYAATSFLTSCDLSKLGKNGRPIN